MAKRGIGFLGGFTLIELLVALALVAGVMLAAGAGLVFFAGQLKANMDKAAIISELSYALEDIKAHCSSASNVYSASNYFDAAGDEHLAFYFQGQGDINNITPDDTTDDVIYGYHSDDNNNHTLMRTTCPLSSSPGSSSCKEEMLVEPKFEPSIKFTYEEGMPANLLKVQVSASSPNVPLGAAKGPDGRITYSREATISFWFIKVVAE